MSADQVRAAVIGDAAAALSALARLGWAIVPARSAELVVIAADEVRAHAGDPLAALQPAPGASPSPLVVVAQSRPEEVAPWLGAGADEVLVEGATEDEVAARLAALVRRARAERDRSPLTGLPGNARLEQVVRGRLGAGEAPALLLADLDGFKAFNDRYGHWRGDRVIEMLAGIMVGAAAADPDALVAHIGGDDFCVVTRPELVNGMGEEAIARFDEVAPAHYDEADRRRGYITTFSRTGRRRQFPLMTLTLVAATAEAEDIEHIGQLFQVLAELKAYAKTLPGSNYFRDRRRDHGWGKQ
ncbi:MAG TPA: GGDEF domain-containing protein [Armatimonadota bacterium]|nr:GGDEF domain-containing protein [Armatimonadota bacterium]